MQLILIKLIRKKSAVRKLPVVVKVVVVHKEEKAKLNQQRKKLREIREVAGVTPLIRMMTSYKLHYLHFERFPV